MLWGILAILAMLAAFGLALRHYLRGKQLRDRTPRPAASAPSTPISPRPHAMPPPRRVIPPSKVVPFSWFGPGSTLAVGDFVLRDPLVYASSGGSARYWDAMDPSEIVIGAPVQRPHSPLLPEMGYWPWYARIEPTHRYAYLEWLASGKRSLPSQEGLLFLYFYGLERRLLVDEAGLGESRRAMGSGRGPSG